MGAPISPLPDMTAAEETVADYETTGLTLGPHPLAHLRSGLARRGVRRAADLESVGHGSRVTVAGSVIVRQRPGTAKGILFITLEDESGMVQAIVKPDLLRDNRQTIFGSPGLVVTGRLQRRDGSLSIQGERFAPLSLAPTPSHDFR